MKHLVQMQIDGLPIQSEPHIKVEYQLRAIGSGRVVMSFDDEARAREVCEHRKNDLYRVTTISEKL